MPKSTPKISAKLKRMSGSVGSKKSRSGMEMSGRLMEMLGKLGSFNCRCAKKLRFKLGNLNLKYAKMSGK